MTTRDTYIASIVADGGDAAQADAALTAAGYPAGQNLPAVPVPPTLPAANCLTGLSRLKMPGGALVISAMRADGAVIVLSSTP